MKQNFDIRWRICSGDWIPLEHRYFLLAALSCIVPELHTERCLGIHPIRGIHKGPGKLKLTDYSAVEVRTPLDLLPALMPLAGRKLDLGGRNVRLTVPEIKPLLPAARLYSPVVTIKGFLETRPFSDAVVRQLDALGVRRSVSLVIGRRRVIQVKDRRIVGFHIRLEDLTPEESLRLQTDGLGGRRHLGCGLFLPDKLRSVTQQVEAV